MLWSRYKVQKRIGQGNFSSALLVHDTKNKTDRCLKVDGRPSLDLIQDLLVIHQSLQGADSEGRFFPRVHEVFLAVGQGYVVEDLLVGKNCLEISQQDPEYFRSPKRLQQFAAAALSALQCLHERAAVIHCDVKPDNFMHYPGDPTSYRLVDFGCSRRTRSQYNWCEAEGGAGHVGHASPEMLLRYPVSVKHDIWALGASLCEVYTGRPIWRSDADTHADISVQILAMAEQSGGVPAYMLVNAPCPSRFFSAAGFPVRAAIQLGEPREELKPETYDLSTILGTSDVEILTAVKPMLIIDPMERPSARECLDLPIFHSALADVSGTALGTGNAAGKDEEDNPVAAA